MAFNGYRNPELQTADTGPNALDVMRSAVQLKGAQQENQQRDLAIQQQTRQVQDDTTIREAYGRNKGDVDKTLQDIAGKVSPQAFQAAQQHAYDLKQKAAALVSQQGDIALKQSDAMQGAHDVVDKADPASKPTVYAQQLAGLQKMGVDVSQMPPQYPGDEQFKTIGLNIRTHSKLTEDAAKQATIGKDTAQAGEATARAGEATANTAKIQAELNFYKKQGLAPGVPLDAQEAADWISKNPGKGPADFMKMKAGLSAQANATAQAGLLSDAAKQMAAQNYTQTGALPTGLRSPTMSAQVLNTAAGGPNGIPNIAANKMNYKADSGSLASLQKNFDQVTAFENTAGKNLDVFLGQAKKVIDSGNPLINRPLRSITGSMGGTDQAAFDAARTTALTEISKVLNSSNASGVLSDSARHEVEGLIKPNATLQQIVSAANILKTDMGNRHQAYQEQINAIKSRGNGAQPQAEAPKGMIQARDPQGKLHQAPAGTALPAGWKLEQ